MFLTKPAVVKFDPSIKEHREAVFAFRRRRAWGDTELRFTYDPAYGSVASQVESKLLQWYIDREVERSQKKTNTVNND